MNGRSHIGHGTPVNALVLVPPFLKYASGPLLGPAMLAGAARKAGHRIQILDLAREWMMAHYAEPWSESAFVGDHDKPSEDLLRIQQDWCSLCAQAWPHELDSEQHAERIMHMKAGFGEVEAAARVLCHTEIGAWFKRKISQTTTPELVGISVLYSGQVVAALALTHLVKAKWPSVPVVWGGAHVTALGEEISRDRRYGSCADGFVFGYAEKTWVELLDSVANGLSWPQEVIRAGEGYRRAKDDPGIVPYFGTPVAWGGRLTLPAQSSRGCAYGRCAFCTYPAIEGSLRNLDLGPVRAVVVEAERCAAAMSFKDSLATIDRLNELSNLIAGRVPWSACTKLHSRLNADFLRQLRAAGCHTLEVGLETLTDSGQAIILKRQAPELFLAFLDAAAVAGVSVVVNYITGLPGTGPDDEQQWLAKVQAEIGARRNLVAKVEHNTFQLERLSPMGKQPDKFGLVVTGSWPWASVLDWKPAA
jgi:hypothetical protein